MAIALTRIWNHITEKFVEIGESFTMPGPELQSLIDLALAKPEEEEKTVEKSVEKPRGFVPRRDDAEEGD